MTIPLVQDTSGRLWIEEGEDFVGPVATVAPILPIDKQYCFRIPPEMLGSVLPGQRVNVPFGKRGRIVPAFCVSIDDRPWDSTLKAIHSLIDTQSYLTDELLELGRWIARYYACPLGRTLAALVPAVVRKQSGYRLVKQVSLARSLEEIEAARGRRKLGPKQQAVLDRLCRDTISVELSQLLGDSGASQATLRTLQAKGWIHIDADRVPAPPPDFDLPGNEPAFELNDDQQAAMIRINALIDAAEFRVALLYGVSGSGKTEVYIRAMRRVLASDRQVIMLVPEIALTTQLVQRLACRFQNVAVIHSGLTGVHRSLTWEAIRSGLKKVIIGTRSAVFAPCPNLGLIVVDEEQESSYKNLQAPRFHVRDVAIKRAWQLSIPVILGSATPSLESWYNCNRLEHYERIELPRRVRNLPMPLLTVLDMNDEYQETKGMPMLSRVLIQRLRETFERREQAVLLMNRRGYANWIICPSCKHRIRCPNCDVNMVFHSARNQFVCHYCSRHIPAPETCPNPSCGAKLIRCGSGTQRIEERLRLLFPEARIARADSDTMRHERAYRRLLTDFEKRRIDCLVGTQMIAKGLDFPFVSFVGVIGADTTLTAPDFRSGERLFQLVMQVAGRAGRGTVEGDVVVQTFSPKQPALSAAVGGDYQAFAKDELEIRQRTRMPPFTRLARIVLSDRDEQRLREAARTLADNARHVITEAKIPLADVLGPMPCTLARLRKRYRYELLLRCKTPQQMQDLLDRLRGADLLKVKVESLIIDVDPVSLT